MHNEHFISINLLIRALGVFSGCANFRCELKELSTIRKLGLMNEDRDQVMNVGRPHGNSGALPQIPRSAFQRIKGSQVEVKN